MELYNKAGSPTKKPITSEINKLSIHEPALIYIAKSFE